MKRFVSLVLMLCLIMGIAVPANAAQSGPGSIAIQVRFDGEPITGGDLVAVRVGYVDSMAKVFRKFVTNDEIANVGSADTVTQMQNFYSAYRNSFAFDSYTAEVEAGTAVFTDVPMGLYLVYQQTAAVGFEKLPAFLVTVPYNGSMQVSIVSKTELTRTEETVPETTDPPNTSETPSSSNQKLPQTGQLTWPVPWMAAAGIVLFVLGWWLCFGRKEEDL